MTFFVYIDLIFVLVLIQMLESIVSGHIKPWYSKRDPVIFYNLLHRACNLNKYCVINFVDGSHCNATNYLYHMAVYAYFLCVA
jgi:hypothetical protein